MNLLSHGEKQIPVAEGTAAVTRTGRPAASARLSSVSWDASSDMTLREWMEHGRRLGLVGRNVAWWIGDWLRYGNQRYGERYPRASRITGYDVQSLMNMTWVASRFPPERRNEALSWSHHTEVAALAPEDQDAWLGRAERERMSVRCLRAEIRAARKGGRDAGQGEAQYVVCPTCGGRVAAGRDDNERE